MLFTNLCLAACCALGCWSDPPSYVVTDRVDLVEVNHFYDSHGKFVLDQVIYYNWCPQETRFHVVDYRLLKSDMQRPIDRLGRDHFSVWHDGNVLRHVETTSFVQTWTQHDPEHRERVALSNDERQGLGTINRNKWRKRIPS